MAKLSICYNVQFGQNDASTGLFSPTHSIKLMKHLPSRSAWVALMRGKHASECELYFKGELFDMLMKKYGETGCRSMSNLAEADVMISKEKDEVTHFWRCSELADALELLVANDDEDGPLHVHAAVVRVPPNAATSSSSSAAMVAVPPAVAIHDALPTEEPALMTVGKNGDDGQQQHEVEQEGIKPAASRGNDDGESENRKKDKGHVQEYSQYNSAEPSAAAHHQNGEQQHDQRQQVLEEGEIGVGESPPPTSPH